MKNPIVRNPEIAKRFDEMPLEAKQAMKDFCDWLYGYAKENAENSWNKSKAPMAVYWKSVAAWAYHIKRFIKVP